MENDLSKQFQFLVEIDKLKKIQRQNILCDSSRTENSAEHSWHLAMSVLALADNAEGHIDILKVLKMVLIHDIVEIDAGDAFLHTKAEQQEQNRKEVAAAERIFSILPKDQGTDFLNSWHEFEEGKTPEAKFAKAIDRVQPALLHEATDMVIWQKYGTTFSQVMNRMEEVRVNTPKLWPKVKSVIDKAVAKGRLIVAD
ncbi:MAG: HD domain-containing protein [Pseudomonadota bacterium]